MGLVVDEQRAVCAGQFAYGGQVAGLGQHDADVGERGFHEDGGDVAVRQLPLQLGGIVELGDTAGERDVAGSADVAGACGAVAVRSDDDERLVDAAVVAVAVHQDLGAVGDGTGEPDRPAVGVRRGQREAPAGEPEPAGEFGADPLGVLRGQHRRSTALFGEPALHGLRDDGGRVACHRSGVAEAEVDVLVAVDVGDAGAPGGVEVAREGTGGLVHPGHRHPSEEVLGAGVGGLRARVEPLGLDALPGEQVLQARAVHGLPRWHRRRNVWTLRPKAASGQEMAAESTALTIDSRLCPVGTQVPSGLMSHWDMMGVRSKT